jgi:methylenetetrahydrofolate reductase (NADPH)
MQLKSHTTDLVHTGAPAEEPQGVNPGDSAVAHLLRNYSAEVTSNDQKSISVVSQMEPGSEVFIASLPSDTCDQQIQAAARIKRAGLTPVPHIVARNIRNCAELDSLLERLVGEAGVDRALMLAGDRDRPAGDFNSSLQLLETGMLAKHGIRKIALSWYPEGHPRISPADLMAARAAKLAVAQTAGLEVVLVSQFCFEAAPIIAAARQIRCEGVKVPLRVGIAGLASRASLLKYAMICGIGTSIRALKERSAARHVLARVSPQELLTELAHAQAADPTLGLQGIHFFTFTALTATIQFIAELRGSRVRA